MSRLFLLTNSYPFGKGEDFITAELPFAQEFDPSFTIISTHANGQPLTKEVPDGARVIALQDGDGKPSLAAYLGLLANPYVIGELFSLLKKGLFTPARAHAALYFARKSARIEDQIKTLCWDQKEDIILYSYWLYDAALAAARLAKRLRKQGCRVTLLSRAHGFDLYPARNKLHYLPFRRQLFHQEEAVFPCSAKGTQFLQQAYPGQANKIHTSYLGTAPGGMSAAKAPFHLVSCSNLLAVKRLDLLINALKLIDFPLKWTHMGDGELREELGRQTAALPPHIDVCFCGQISNQEVRDFYQSASPSAFINVSSSEGLPVTIMEAASFGLPVIATDVGGNAEGVMDGQSGVLLPADPSPNEVAEAITRLYKMKEHDYRNTCLASLKLWEEKFDAQSNYKAFYQSIGEIAANKGVWS